MSKNLFHGVKIPIGGPAISHLFYANDALFVGTWVSSNFSNLARVLKCFHIASGLNVNFHKSKVFGIEVFSNEVSSCARNLGCEAAWNAKYLSFGGRLTLVKSFLGSLRVFFFFFFSLFKAPKSVTMHLENLRRRFWAHGSKWAWEGGRGECSLISLN